MVSSRVVLARECCANLALNLLIESENVCLFLWWWGWGGGAHSESQAGGTAGVHFNEIHLSALLSVLRRGNSERFYELIGNFKKHESSAVKITPLCSRPRLLGLLGFKAVFTPSRTREHVRV